MTIPFSKYQGTGNDFVIIDNRNLIFFKNDTKRIRQLCDRKFGIGADGLILLENHPTADFTMVYYNADGNQSSMCGNGGRCVVAFAKALQIISKSTTFMAIDGLHEASIEGTHVHLKMKDVTEITSTPTYTFLDTGSPHHIELTNNLKHTDVKTKGSAVRCSSLYGEAGANVNFVNQIGDSSFAVRTYERGVEDETLSCGTGATAVALAAHHNKWTEATQVQVLVEGGELAVSFSKTAQGYQDVFLIGPAMFVFKGTWG